MRIQQLEEGIIKVPPKFLNTSIVCFLQVLSTTMIRHIKRGVYLKGSEVEIYKLYDVAFDDYGDKFDVLNEDGMRSSFKLSANRSDLPYKKGGGVININLYFDANLTRNNGYYQPLYTNVGTVVISVHDVISAAKFSIQIDDFYDNDPDMQSNLRDGIFPMDFNVSLLALVRKVIGTIEHELAHAMQFLVLKHQDQTKSNKGHGYGDSTITDEYWKSPVEFSPQIISAARNFDAYIENLSFVIPSQRMKIFMYAIGERSFDSLGINTSNSIGLLNSARSFFTTLKSKKPKAFKKAVKLLYDELDKNDSFTK